MKTSSMIPNQLLKLFFRNFYIVILTLSLRGLLAGSQQVAVTYNDTRQSLNQTQALSCDLARANDQQISLLSSSNVNKNIPDRHEDLDNAAATTNFVQIRPSNVGASPLQDQETSPSVTSVHQVWTSSSSGGIGELSPEIISKLRNDVPFLAAYALRPRLVGVSSQDDINNPILKSTRVNNDDGRQFVSNSQPIDSYAGQTQPPASAEKASLQVQASSPSATKSLIPKLGDFSEFNVETSSTSKSEHHHKRKTTLKRDSNDTGQLDLKRRSSGPSSAGLSVKGGPSNGYKRKSIKNKKQKLKAGKTNKRGRKGGVGKIKNRLRSSKSRGKLNKGNLRQHMNIIKRGRYYQEQTISPTDSEKSTDMVIDSKSAGDQTTTVISGTKGSSEGEIKGGSPGERKPPFYSRAKPAVDSANPMRDVLNKSITNDVDDSKDDSDIDNLNRTRSKGEEDDRSREGEPDEVTLEEPLEPPRRVGDDDVEEEGDTVTVMPKSDGVDDDPEIPVGAPEEDQSGPVDGDQDGSREREEDGDGRDSGNPESQGEPRARRVDRERPNPESKPSQGSNNDANGRDITAGGGIGATTGSGGVGDVPEDRDTDSTPSQGDHRQDDGLDLDEDQDKFGSRGGSSVGSGGDTRTEDDRSIGEQETTNGRPEMGKESNSSDQEDDDRFNGGSNSSKGVSKENSDSDNGSTGSTSLGEPGEFDSRRSRSDDRDRDNKSDDNNKNVGGNAKPPCRDDGSPCLDDSSIDDEGGDVDYRDEMAESALGKKNGRNETTEVTTGKVDDEQSITKKNKKKVESEKKDCDDHHLHKDGHYDHHDHHDHHDSIKWLQDAIPGEPGEDYPILSRINLSNFNCRDQKYPGYYADVQSRCQVSDN